MVAATITAPTWIRTDRRSPHRSPIRSSQVAAPSRRCSSMLAEPSARSTRGIHTTVTAAIRSTRAGPWGTG